MERVYGYISLEIKGVPLDLYYTGDFYEGRDAVLYDRYGSGYPAEDSELTLDALYYDDTLLPPHKYPNIYEYVERYILEYGIEL